MTAQSLMGESVLVKTKQATIDGFFDKFEEIIGDLCINKAVYFTLKLLII